MLCHVRRRYPSCGIGEGVESLMKLLLYEALFLLNFLGFVFIPLRCCCCCCSFSCGKWHFNRMDIPPGTFSASLSLLIYLFSLVVFLFCALFFSFLPFGFRFLCRPVLVQIWPLVTCVTSTLIECWKDEGIYSPL